MKRVATIGCLCYSVQLLVALGCMSGGNASGTKPMRDNTGSVSIEIPSNWTIKVEDAETVVAYDARAKDESTIRLSVVKAQLVEPPSRDSMLQMVASLGQPVGEPEWLDEETLYSALEETAFERGEDLDVRRFMILRRSSPTRLDIVIVTYTMLSRRKSSHEYQETLKWLLGSVRGAMFLE